MTIRKDSIQAVLFDIDGTLSDSDDLMVANVEKIFSSFLRSKKRRHTVARWLVMAAESPGNFFYNQADRFDLDSVFIKILNIFSKKKRHRVKKYWIIPGVAQMLEELSHSHKLGIVSARDNRTSLAFLRQFDLERYFHVVVTSQTCRYTKPFPDPLLYAAQELGVEPDTCLMVGDTTVDIKAAKLAGMQAVGVLCGFGRRKELERAGADLILSSTTDLSTLISSEK